MPACDAVIVQLPAPATVTVLVAIVQSPLEFTVAELKTKFEPVEIVAVNQCSGNGRGFSQPRVPGGQMGNGAMGNARWKGARLKDVDLLQEARHVARSAQCRGRSRELLTPVQQLIAEYGKGSCFHQADFT